MVDKKQKNNVIAEGISPLSQDLTYGERKHNLIFNKLINFWINLSVSALFTYWVSHYQKPIANLGGIEISSPSMIQKKIAKVINWLPPMRVFGEHEEFRVQNPPDGKRAKAATNLANVFTLVAAGHPIMIGSVWLGAKVKAPMVKWFNRLHYGDEAMDSADLKARHAAIEMEERPTLWGAIVGRLGTIVATQVVGYTIGNKQNLIGGLCELIGVKKFPGIDSLSGAIGEKLGGGIEGAMDRMVPEVAGKTATQRLENHLTKSGYSWSTQQIQDNAALKTTPYKNPTQHLTKYLAQDVMYSFVTAVSIAPAINFLKHYIPGLTYKPKLNPKNGEENSMLAAEAKRIRVAPNPIADQADMTEKPASRVSGGKTAAPLVAQPLAMNHQAMV